jgi:ribonuclease VapC
MFVDASAIIAILAAEDDRWQMAERISAAEKVYLSPLSMWEATIGLIRKRQWTFEEAEDLVREFSDTSSARLVHIDSDIGQEALRAARTYGRGRHPAALNFGDCFAYACAKVLNVPLLAKGNDFPQTDIELA